MTFKRSGNNCTPYQRLFYAQRITWHNLLGDSRAYVGVGETPINLQNHISDGVYIVRLDAGPFYGILIYNKDQSITMLSPDFDARISISSYNITSKSAYNYYISVSKI